MQPFISSKCGNHHQTPSFHNNAMLLWKAHRDNQVDAAPWSLGTCQQKFSIRDKVLQKNINPVKRKSGRTESIFSGTKNCFATEDIARSQRFRETWMRNPMNKCNFFFFNFFKIWKLNYAWQSPKGRGKPSRNFILNI